MISVVIPAHNEEPIIPLLYRRIAGAATAWNEDWELLIVDDGSTDGTFSACQEIAATDHRLKVLRFSRNFGHQAAVTAGLFHASGDIVAVMDADLQDPPEELIRFINKCREGNDVVYAIRTKRKEGPIKRLTYHLYYRLLKSMASIDIPLDSGDFCVMNRRVLEALRDLPERNRFVRGLRSWVGYRQVGLTYERQARQAGEPKYTLAKLIRLGLDGVINFSYKPLHILMLIGLSIGTLSFFLGALVFVMYVADATIAGYNPRNTQGWTSLMIVMLFVAGVQLFGLGILGEYIGRIFEETKRRPTYIIGASVNLEQSLGGDRSRTGAG